MKKIWKFLIISILIISCREDEKNFLPTHNGGGYTITKLYNSKLKKEDSVLITGTVTPINKMSMNPITTVKFGCTSISSSTGQYKIKTDPASLPYQFSCLSLGYLTIETAPIHLLSGDSIIIHFVVDEDKRPIINCEYQ